MAALRVYVVLSFPHQREFSDCNQRWIPASAGMTLWLCAVSRASGNSVTASKGGSPPPRGWRCGYALCPAL